MSFFDEDDEPPRRTTQPRRAATPGGGAGDPQAIMMRRAAAIGAALVIAVLLLLVFRACQNSRQENALKDYNAQISDIVRESDQQVGQPFFQLMSEGGESAQDLQTAISGYRVTAEQHLDQARDLDVPGEMAAAQASVLEALELRRDGLDAIAQRVLTALGDEGDAADEAFEQIAGQMRAFLASDVLWQARVAPLVKAHLDEEEIGGQRIATSTFFPDDSWLEPATVADRLGRQVSGDGGNGGEPAPGLHGNGLVSVQAGDVVLQPGVANRVPADIDAFLVTFANQGENDEFDVRVTLTIEGDSGEPIRSSKTVDEVLQGQQAEVAMPVDEPPPVGEPVTITVEIEPVPGEEKTDNNSQTYQALFVE